MAAITGLVAGQVKLQRQAGEVALDVDLGTEAAARTAESLALVVSRMMV